MEKPIGEIDLKIVEAISNSPDSSIKSLADKLDMRAPEVEKHVTFLMRYGLLASKANKKGILELTAKGQLFFEKRDPKIIAGYSPADSVPDYLAFRFAAGEGMMTGDVAHSYQEFLDVVKRVDSRSLVYHLYRGDFDNWISEVFRDKALSEKLIRLKSTVRPVDQLRTKMIRLMEGRLAELRGG
jgi:DNA-binding MarR family transcriptional regulator